MHLTLLEYGDDLAGVSSSRDKEHLDESKRDEEDIEVIFKIINFIMLSFMFI